MKIIGIGLCAVSFLLAETGLSEADKVASDAEVTVLCYHRFEETPRDGLAISPEDFRSHLQSLKDRGIEVISMEDFLAWRRGEVSIPPRSAIITIDDGYLSGYSVAWPILKEFGYPFTMYIYTDYVKGGPRSGGQSMTWEQLREMHDAGVDIGSHSISHASLSSRKGRSEAEYLEWLRAEIGDSKKMIEENLGIQIKTFTYPYGNQNETVRQIAKESGYEAAFTVRGEKLGQSGDPMQVGRYAIESTKPEVFDLATQFRSTGTLAAASVNPESPSDAPDPGNQAISPLPGSTLSGALPEISINLEALGNVEPGSLVMVISGLGVVPATFDPETLRFSYRPVARLYAPEVTVAVSGRADGKKFQERWSYATEAGIPSLSATRSEM